MRDYAKVSPLFWTGTTGRQIKALGQDAQLAALYLMTSPAATMLGVYHLPAVLLAHATGSPYEGALKALRSLSGVGFCVYDEASEWLWVKEMAAWQIDDELAATDNRVKGIAKDWLALPNLPMLQEFFDRYGAAFHLPSRAKQQAPSKPLLSPSQDPPKPGAGAGAGAGEKKKTSAPTGAGLGSFDRFWATYPKKKSKGDAERAWKKLPESPELEAKIAAAVESQKRSPDWLRESGRFIPYAASWLNAKGWLDEVAVPRSTDGVGSYRADELAP